VESGVAGRNVGSVHGQAQWRLDSLDPAYDGDSLYVAGMRDVLVCLDAKTGKQRWRVTS